MLVAHDHELHDNGRHAMNDHTSAARIAAVPGRRESLRTTSATRR
jgi:hypothetical protein